MVVTGSMPLTRRSSPRVLRSMMSAQDATTKKRKQARKSTVAAVMAVAAVASAALPDGASALSSHSLSPSKTVLYAKPPRDVTPSPAKKKKIERTNSFDPMWAGSLEEDKNVAVHTLILGTHPSITSLSESQYYGHPMNSFWWIAGDCLGFRRSSGISPSSGEPYKFTSQVRYGTDRVIPYEDQVRIMASHGFAMWDIVGSCERQGSLDSAIENEVPNDIVGFCETHPCLRRIVLANGSTGSKIFMKHFQEWWLSGELKPGENKESQLAFHRKALAKATNNYENAKITCISAVSVSPAAASYTYEQKRDFWEKHVYQPALQDFKSHQQQTTKTNG